jgi:RNA polymerase sigma-70 factor (ECF subfamily)
MVQGPDEDLANVQAAQRGNLGAFEALFVKYRDRAAALAFRYTHSHEDALDVVQDAFIKVFRSLGEFRGQSRFVHWLFRIVANTAIDARRAKGSPEAVYDEARESEGVTVADPSAEADPARVAASREVQAAYQKALAELSPEHRAVFELHVTKGLSYSEIAQQVGVPIGTVMSRLFYARKQLQQKLSRFWRESEE